MPAAHPAFTSLISSALQEPDWPVFDEDYESVLGAVHEGGTFEFHGLQLSSPAGVYPPRAGGSTRFMADHWGAQGMHKNPKRMLEIGCGSGALSLLAQRLGWDVSACDVDALAVATAQANAHANGATLNAYQSDLFSAVPAEEFDVIVFNFPLYHKPAAESREIALADQQGDIAARFFRQAPQFLKTEGFVLFTFSNCSRGELLENPAWKFEVLGCDYFARGRYWRAVIKGTPRS